MKFIPEALGIIEVELPIMGRVKIEVTEYVDILNSYEEEMREQASRYAFIDAVKAELDSHIENKVAHLEAWRGSYRESIAADVAVRLGKSKASIDDLEAAIASSSEYLVQSQHITDLKKYSHRLGGLLTALSQRRSMLEQLAQHERSGLSMFTVRTLSVAKPEDGELEAQMQTAKRKFVTDKEAQTCQ